MFALNLSMDMYMSHVHNVNRHLKILNSYIQSPQIHAAAVKNPQMRGGPFIDFNGARVEEAKALRDETVKKQHHRLAFAQAVGELSTRLETNARGDSMGALYSQGPDVLKGYGDLVYELNNNTAFRCVESCCPGYR